MSDISFGLEGYWGYLFLIDILSIFLISSIPAFYLSFLLLKKTKLLRAGNILLSIIFGSIIGFFAFPAIYNFFSTFFPSLSAFLLGIIPISIVVLEINVIIIHFRKLPRKKKLLRLLKSLNNVFDIRLLL